MAYNGSGGWNRLYNWQNDAANNIKIRADRMDNEMNDMCNNGLGAVITRDGQGAASADQPMNTHKHLNVGNALLRNQYPAVGQIQDGGLVYTIAGGTADALTAAFTPTIPALVDGMVLRVKAAFANATTVPAIAVDANAAATITKLGGQPLAIADIFGAGHDLELQYSSTGPRFELLNPSLGAATLPTRQTLISGTTYTTPARCRQLRIRMVGGGGGGAGGNSATGPAGAGGNTTFGTSLLTCNGGAGAAGGASPGGGAGAGTATGGGLNITGNGGAAGAANSANAAVGGLGGVGPFGGGGGTPLWNGAGAPGAANSGAGGSGGSASTGTGVSGGGGQAGGYLEAIINNPAATYAYVIGAGGTVVAPGGGGGVAGVGGSGLIIVDEIY